jgi:hypothetical protein
VIAGLGSEALTLENSALAGWQAAGLLGKGLSVLITNETNQDYWFGPLHLPAGVNQTLTIDDSSATSLYLLNDEVADAVAYLQAQGKIQVSSVTAGIPFPRATGTPRRLIP